MTRYYKKIPQGFSDSLPPIQPTAAQPLGDCEKSYYYAIAKKGYSHNELLFIISHLISILTKGNVKEHKKTNQEHLNPGWEKTQILQDSGRHSCKILQVNA